MRFQTTTTAQTIPPSVQFGDIAAPKTFSGTVDSGDSLSVTDSGSVDIMAMVVTWTALDVAGWIQVNNMMRLQQIAGGGAIPMSFNPPLHVDGGLWVQNNSIGGTYSVFMYYREV